MNGRPILPSPFEAPTLEQLTALVFELASQLHAERVHRIAMEAALEAAGVLVPGAADGIASRADVHAKALASLDRSMAAVMRVLTEGPDPRTPLRTQNDKPR